jgi:hypothetical protein
MYENILRTSSSQVDKFRRNSFAGVHEVLFGELQFIDDVVASASSKGAFP